MRKTMKKLTQGATRLLVLALGLGLVSTGWAANGNGTLNYELTASGDSGLYAAVVDNRIDKRIASSASFGTKVFTLASPTLEIPASDTLPAGTKIKVTQIEFCRNSQNDANSEAIYVKINDVTSGARVVGGGYSSTIGIGANGAASGTGVKITYNFSPALEVVVGTSYDVEFLNASSEALSSVKYCYVSSTGNGSVAAQSLLNLDGSDKVLFKVTGTVEYTFNAAGGPLSLNDGANWTSGAAPAIGSPNVSFNVTADTTVNVAANTSYAKVSITGDHQLTLSGSQVTASDGFFVKDNATFAPGFTIASIVDISATAKVVANSGETIYVSNFKGAGTIVFDGVLPSSANAASSTVTASATDSSNWTGTLWLKNYNTDEGSKGLYVSYWCNANSKLKFTNVFGYLPTNGYLGYDGSELGEWILEDEVVDAVTKYAFTKTDGYSGYWVRFKKLSGSGTMAEKSGKSQTPQVRIADGSEFTGTLKLDQGMRVAFSDSDVSSINAKQIVIASGEEVTASKSWTTAGFVVDGTLNLNATPSGNIVSGSGTINLGSLSVANGISGFASAAAWTGKVVVPAFTSSGTTEINCNNLGSQSSTLIFKGITRNSFDGIYVQPVCGTVNPTIQLDGNVELTNGNASPTYFSKVTGTGNLSFRGVWQGATLSWKINTLSGYTGTLTADNATASSINLSLSIGTLALDNTPSVSDRLVNINSNAELANIVDVEDIAVTVGGEATEYKLVKKNVGTATAGLYLAPAAIKASDGTFTTYESVDAAFTALSSLENDAYDYMAVYDSATVTYSNSYKTPKIKTIGDGVVLTLNSGYGDYGWAAGSPGEDGVVTYSFGPIPATYTWVGAENASWFAVTSWQCGGDAANRFIGTTDNAIFSSDASVTISGNYTVASITNNANVTFTAASAQTITVGDGGVVMTALGNSITLTNVTLSKVPTTTAATLAVQTTGGGDDPIVYTVVNAVASVDGVGYATMSEASLALKTGSIMTLQQDYDGTVTIYPGKYLVQNGHTVTSVIGAATDDTTDDGIVVTRSGNSVANYYWSCVDQRTATWSGAGSAYWTVMGNWVEQFTPTTYTAVTIPATEGHATAITLSGDVSIKSLTLCAGETLTLSRSGDADRTFTTSQAIVLTSGQSIVTGAGVSISPAIITEDANSYVKSVTLDGATTYSVADHKATVYDSEDAEVKKYDTVADAVSAATDGQKVTLFADSGEAITLNGKSLTFNEGSCTFTGSFTGSGTLVLPALWKSGATTRIASGWTGTVVLPNVNGTDGGFRFDYYGKSGSTIKIENGFNGWLNTEVDARQVKANLIVNSAFTINGTNSGTWYNLAKMSGTGNFSLIQSNAPAGFHILVLEDYSGTLSNTIGSGTPTALTVSRLNLAEAPVAGQKLINTTTPNAVNLETVYVGDVQQSVTLAKGSDGIYAALVSVTKGSNPTTYYATVSDAMTAAGSDAATITLLGSTDSNVSLAVGQSLVTGGFSVGTVSTSVANYHVVNNAGVYTVVHDPLAVTIPSVANTTVSVSYTSGGVAQIATAAGDISVDYGTSLTATWTAVSGYQITANAEQTINPVVAAQTLTSPTVEEMSAVVSNVNFTYGADYTTAEVTATITGDATSATLTYGSNTYNAQVSNGTVTFTDVVVSRDSGNIYAPVSYTITTDAHATTGGSGSAVAADTTAWFSQSSANSGAPVGGSWATAVNLSTPTNVTDNMFAATSPSTSSRVVLEFEVCFSSTSEEDVSGEAQAAIKLGVVNSVTTFMVLTNGNEWAAVSAVGLEPDASATYKVVLTIDYGSNAYGVTVGNYVMTNSTGSASFPLAANKSSVQTIDFAGSGTLTSLKGDQVEGYMVVDKNGTRYPSIAAAINAYTQDPSIGPLRVLHDGTPPSGWKIDEATKNLIKVAKGLFFMAY